MNLSPRVLFVFTGYMINDIICQILPPIGNQPSCKTCTTTPKITTTIHPYFLCDTTEYYVQGQCKNYTTAYCSDRSNIVDGLVPCGYSDAVIFKNIIVFLGEERCNFYFSLTTCLRKRIQSNMPICTSAEIQFTLNQFIDDLASPIGVPHQRLYLLDKCQVFSNSLTLKVMNTAWSSSYNDKSSEYFWIQRDRHDNQVSSLVSAAFPDEYRDSVVTDIRYNDDSIQIDVTILWKENLNNNTSDILEMIQEQVNSSTATLVYRIESVTFINGSNCVYEGISYNSGELFRTSDLCNRCVCNNGSVYCTNMSCTAVWLGEYCNSTSDCGVQHSVCVNYTCNCEQHFFGVLLESTRICRKRGLYEVCSSVEDCEGPNVECRNEQCLCLDNYIDVNDTCVFFTRYGDQCDNICYANYTHCVSDTCLCIPGYFTAGNNTTCVRRPVEADETSQTTILIIVVCSVTLFILFVVLAVLFKRTCSKNRLERKGIKKKTLKNEDTGETDYVPTSLHVKPYLTSNFYKARLAKPYKMGHFDFDKVDTDA